MRIRAKTVTKTTPAPVQSRDSSAVRVKATSSLSSVDEVLLWKPTVQMSEDMPEAVEAAVSAPTFMAVEGVAEQPEEAVVETQANVWVNADQETESAIRETLEENILESAQANEPQPIAAEQMVQQENEVQTPYTVRFEVVRQNVRTVEPMTVPNPMILAEQENVEETPYTIQFEQENVPRLEPIIVPNPMILAGQENETQTPYTIQLEQENVAESPYTIQFEQENARSLEPIIVPNPMVLAEQENVAETPYTIQFEQENVRSLEPIIVPNPMVLAEQENEAQTPYTIQLEQENAPSPESTVEPNPVVIPEQAEPVRITQPIPAPLIPPEQPVQTACPGKPYTVRRGDSFQLIAKRFGVSVRGLLEANPELQPGRLMVGDVLCIPVGGTAAQRRATLPSTNAQTQQTGDRHRVAEGESIADILVGGDISLSAFQAANPRVRLGYQQVGDWLRMPSSGARGMCAQGTPYKISGQANVAEVAQHLGISIGALLRANAHLLPSDFYEGQVICVPKV